MYDLSLFFLVNILLYICSLSESTKLQTDRTGPP